MSEKKGFNRRDFLKVIGAGTGLAATGCGTDIPEKIIPYVVQPNEVVPGVAVWYTGTCTECSAGCGVLVRTREGRAVKVEGNPEHPVNKGGLCAIGQSSVQGLYDPDRIREPLMRDVNGVFKPVSWKEALDAVADALARTQSAGKETIFLTKPLVGSEAKLTKAFLGKLKKTRHVEYDLLGKSVLNQAAEKTFGPGLSTHYDFSAAKVILGVGADYLETWLSPAEFMKGYSKNRKPDSAGKISTVYHVEPRLSLTAANADTWLVNTPGTEVRVLRAVFAALHGKKGGSLSELAGLRDSINIKQELKVAGIDQSKFDALIADLLGAESSLVVAGGASASGAHALESAVYANLINVMLGNIGKSVLLFPQAKTQRPLNAELAELVSTLETKEAVGVVLLSGVNPAYALPETSKIKSALGKAAMVVAVSSHLDETSKLAQVVLPLSTSFESWLDGEPQPGVFTLNQPAMKPLYKTQSYGDTLLSLDGSDKLKASLTGGAYEDYANFMDYIKASWKERTGESNFDARWTEYVEKGGDWSKAQKQTNGRSVQSSVKNLLLRETDRGALEGISLLAFPTAQFADGKSANRPWLQEIPDPMTTSVWGSWIEIHPDTAAELGVEAGEVLQVKLEHGSIEAPLYITKNIHPKLVAAPMGLGHEGYGRYASGVGSNPLSILPFRAEDGGLQFFAPNATLRKSVAKETLVTLQGSDTQLGRGFIRSVTTDNLADLRRAHQTGTHKVDHHDRLQLGPRGEVPQMYKQMEHSLYRWGMTIDVAACTGCSACVTACYAENNVPVVGKDFCNEGREMSWIRISRFVDGPEDHPVTGFAPMLCQHCGHAPCEPVCPVYATYHGEDGLNTMVYNRCVGTRYCSNNCSYKVRRFNWFNYEWPEPLTWQLNPDVTVRSVGVMEKCSFCIQRIREAQNNAKNDGRLVRDGEIQPACASSCPAEAISFGNLLDKESVVAKEAKSERGYKILDFELNTQPAITYLAKVTHREIETIKPGHHDDEHHAAGGEKDEHHHG